MKSCHQSFPGGFHAHHVNILFLIVGREQSHGVRTAAHTRHKDIRIFLLKRFKLIHDTLLFYL